MWQKARRNFGQAGGRIGRAHLAEAPMHAINHSTLVLKAANSICFVQLSAYLICSPFFLCLLLLEPNTSDAQPGNSLLGPPYFYLKLPHCLVGAHQLCDRAVEGICEASLCRSECRWNKNAKPLEWVNYSLDLFRSCRVFFTCGLFGFFLRRSILFIRKWRFCF